MRGTARDGRGTATVRGRYGLLGAALLFSTGGAAIKACSLSSWQVAGFRSAIAAAAMAWLCVPGLRSGARPGRNAVWTWRTFAAGAFYAATLILFVLANKLTTSANAIFLQSTAPLYLLIVGPLVLREPVRRADVGAMAAVALGMALLLAGSETVVATAPDPRLGNVLAAASGLTWALTIAGLRWMGKSGDESAGPAMVVAGNLIVFVVCLPMAWPVTRVSAADAGILLYLGIFQVGLAYALLTRSLKQVPGLEASMLLLAEPVFNPVWSWLVHGERPSLAAAGGGLAILTAAVVRARAGVRIG